MLMNLMFHGVGSGKHENPLSILDAHFSYIKQYPIVLPGDELISGLNICLTFDDARKDFYADVFPLLSKHGLSALLAVPTGLIGDEGYCSWKMLKEMRDAGCVRFASHSHTHPNMTESCDLDLEIRHSKALLKERLGVEVETFVYPYGRWSPALLDLVKKEYVYSMRIGSGYSKGWSPLMMRIPADRMETPSSLFAWQKRLRWSMKELFERNIS
jgi:peptidoglycan/xylan/chitin deacetylase (PgdA/CDA1 family)